MFNYLKATLLAFALTAIFFISVAPAEAATLFISPTAKSLKMGEESSFDLLVDSDAVINATQATVQFPADILELVGVNRSGSVFNFWVEEPVISNVDGTLKFVGGTSKGVAGKSLKVLSLQFKARGIGKKDIGISDAVITAADGKGTNVLASVAGANIVVSTEAFIPPTQVESVAVITRAPEAATGLPVRPTIRVPMYPQAGWYSHIGEVLALWDVPMDATSVSASISKNPNATPGAAEVTLVNGKNFGKLSEGTWYVNAQFKNNIGWGSVAHYKIQIDVTSPLAFKIQTADIKNDNPSPRLEFKTQDALSGLAHAVIYDNGVNIMESADMFATLLPLKPGKHAILVKVFDLAGNSVEDSLEIETLPLAMPNIVFITDSMVEGETLFAQGKSIGSGYVDVVVTDQNGRVVFTGTADSDKDGNWAIKAKEPLARGTYSVVATARDNRGAVSYPTEVREVKVKAKPILTIFGVELGWMGLLIFALLLLLAGIAYFTRFYMTEEEKRAAYTQILGEDIKKFGDMMTFETDKINSVVSKTKWPDENTKVDLESRVVKMRDVVEKMKKYLGK
jgi:hypothetical protein